MKEEEFSPKRYVWKMTGAATGEAETDSSTHTFVASLTKGKDKKLNFSVVGKICGICDGEVESDKATDSVEIYVYELSMSRPDYLGLDRTDEGRKSHTVTNARVSVLPVFSGTTNVLWTACGICEFVGPTNQTSVQYRNKDFETASESVGKERLVASVKLAGMDSSVFCSTNFTVVKVDVKIGAIGEDKEESEGGFVQYVPDELNGSITVEGTNKMVAVSFSCEPELPVGENVTVSFSGTGELYEKLASGELIVITAANYSACDISTRVFKLHGHEGSDLFRDGRVSVVRSSGHAIDKAAVTIVGVKTETVATTPADRTRKTVGVGEEVTARFYPSSSGPVIWSVNGGGSIDKVSGNPIQFTATNRASTATITAESSGLRQEVLLSIIEPGEVRMRRIASKTYPVGFAGAGMYTEISLHPTTVSFYKVETREIPGPASDVTGYFTNFPLSGLFHNPSPNWGSYNQSNVFLGYDDCSTPLLFGPWSNGSFTWHIPWHFRVGAADGGIQFAVVDQTFSIWTNGTVEVSKAGAFVRRTP